MRHRGSAVSANPTLVGAVTLLVTIVAVFLAYNANNGLPFVPTYELRADVPDASELTVGNDVRLGGTRVGQVSSIQARTHGDRPVARLELKLSKDAGPLRADTRLVIRQRSNVGLKYVELIPGTRGPKLPDGATLALTQATAPVDLDDSLSTYDAPTRRNLRDLLSAFGNGVAGRGAALNTALSTLPQTFGDLTVVARLIAAPSTDLDGFVRGLAGAAQTVAPVAKTLADAFDTGATTFAALGRPAFGRFFDAQALLERTGTPALHDLRPVLAEGAVLARDLRPGVAVLPAASERIALALQRTGPALGRTRLIAAPLGDTITTLRRVARNHDTTGALERLTDVVRATVPTLRHFNPIQTKCDALGIWTRNVPSVVSEGDANGTWFRFVQILKLDESAPIAYPSDDLHYYTIPDAGQHGSCEAGNETYTNPSGRVIGRTPGVQPDFTENTPGGTLAQRVAAEGPQK
jgi:virulence factor Mce-like protein